MASPKPGESSAREYRDAYKKDIGDKFIELRTTRDSALLALKDTWPESDEERAEIQADFRKDMRRHVQAAQSDKEYRETKRQHHKDMKKVKRFFHTILDINKLDTKDPAIQEKIKNIFAASKEYFAWIDEKDWEFQQKAFEKFLRKVTPEQKEHMLAKVHELLTDPKALEFEMKKIAYTKPNMAMIEKVKRATNFVFKDFPSLVDVYLWATLLGSVLHYTGNETSTTLAAWTAICMALATSIVHAKKFKDINEAEDQERAHRVIK